MSVAFAEYTGGEKGEWPKEVWDNGVLNATRLVVCAWADRHTLLSEQAWEKYPYCSITDAYPYGATVEGFGDPDGTGPIAEYSHAYVWIRYTNRIAVNVGTNLLISEEMHPYSMHLPLDPEGFRWVANSGSTSVNIKPNEAPSKVLRCVQYRVTYFRVTNVPAQIVTYADCVNNATITSNYLGLSFSAEQVLFCGGTVRRDFYLASTPKLQVTNRFLIHPDNWNKFWQPKTGTWEYMYHAQGSGPALNYTPVNLSSVVPS